MATWKKVIVSGSNAELNQITASGGINATLPSSQQSNFVSYNQSSGQLGYFGTGSLTAATASYVTGSNVYGPNGSNSILSASYAVSSSYASNATTATTASYVLQAVSASFATLAQTANTASYVVTAQTASYVTTAQTASYVTGSVHNSTNPALSASYASTSSYVLNAISASYAATASYVVTAQTASYVLQAVSASFATLAQTSNTASYVVTAQTASYVLQAVSASLAATASNIFPAITNNTDNRVLTATGGGTINGESTLTFDGTTLTVTGNEVITGNLTVQGTASFQNTTNLEVADRFVLFASGSNTTGDGGIVVQQGTQNVGELYGYDSNTTRWGFTSSFSASNAAFAPAAYITTTETGTPVPSAAPIYGGSGTGFGNIYVKTDTGDIYIYA